MDQFNPGFLRELLATTEDTLRLWEGTDIAADRAQRVFRRGCGLFRELEGSRFHEWLSEVAQGVSAHEKEAQPFLDDLDKYLHFLEIDRAILARAGLDAKIADIVLHHLALFRRRVSLTDALGSYTAPALQAEIAETAKAICGAADHINQAARQQERWRAVRYVGLQMAGWTLTCANGASYVAAIVATAGLAVPPGAVSLLSMAGGRALIAASGLFRS